MSRMKTLKERRQKFSRKKKFGGNSAIKPEVKPIDINTLTEECQDFIFSRMERNVITRNTPCPCNSGHRFKNCHMETK